MNREEEIFKAMGDAEWKHVDGAKDIELFDAGFQEGARWADAHPLCMVDLRYEQHRYEIAKDICAGVVARVGLNAVDREKLIADFAVNFADALLERLKGGTND